MADVTITPSTVEAGAGAVKLAVKSGEAFNAGQVVRKNAANKWVKAQADNLANSGTRTQLGIALFTAAGDNQEGSVLLEGDLTCDGLTQGVTYVLSATAGLIAPVADLVSTNIACVVGVAVNATTLRVKFNNSGVALP